MFYKIPLDTEYYDVIILLLLLLYYLLFPLLEYMQKHKIVSYITKIKWKKKLEINYQAYLQIF